MGDESSVASLTLGDALTLGDESTISGEHVSCISTNVEHGRDREHWQNAWGRHHHDLPDDATLFSERGDLRCILCKHHDAWLAFKCPEGCRELFNICLECEGRQPFQCPGCHRIFATKLLAQCFSQLVEGPHLQQPRPCSRQSARLYVLLDLQLTLLNAPYELSSDFQDVDDQRIQLGLGDEKFYVFLRSHCVELLVALLQRQLLQECQLGFFTPWPPASASLMVCCLLLQATGVPWIPGRRPEILIGSGETWGQHTVLLFDEIYCEYDPFAQDNSGGYRRNKSLDKVWGSALSDDFCSDSTVYVTCLRSELRMLDSVENLLMARRAHP